jgi:uncharacterized protein YbaR (Trm112 family)
MRRQWLAKLCCPLDRAGPLTLHALAEEGDEVLEGALLCPECGRWYAIMEGVPHLVRDGLRLVEDEMALLRKHAGRLPAGAGDWKPFGEGAEL